LFAALQSRTVRLNKKFTDVIALVLVSKPANQSIAYLSILPAETSSLIDQSMR